MRPLALLAFCIIWLTALPAGAKSTLIDDSGTLPYDTPITLQWQQASPRPPVNNTLTGTTTIRVRLKVGPWLRRAGRIYLILPAQPLGSLTASWTTQGRLLAGRVTSGSRTLVYAGVVTTPFIEEVLQLTLSVDARQMRQLSHINFQFQMDED